MAQRPGISSDGYGNVVPCWNHDIQYDPVWRIYQKDVYALLQANSLVEFASYSYSWFAFYEQFWGLYHYAYQTPGKGDGSDGLFNNRTCLATPGQPYSKAANVSQDQTCVSVRGQAHLEWMWNSGALATLSGPTAGGLGFQSTAFTVTLNEPALSGGVIVTPFSSSSADTFQAALGGSNVSNVLIAGGSIAVTFYVTPGGTMGNRSIAITTGPALTYSGTPITYSATGLPTTATLSGPGAGIVGVHSSAFTVSLDEPASTGGVIVTLASTIGGDTFQATAGGGNVSSVTIPAGSTAVAFFITPGGTAGNRNISITTSPSLTYSGSPLSYNASSITIPAGSTSVTFYLTPGGTGGNRSISITTLPALTYSGTPITYSAAAPPTAATLSGPSSGVIGTESTAFTVSVNQPASTGGVTVTPGSTSSGDTFQATSGGSNVSSVTIPAGSTSVMFYLTPGGTAGNRSISITTSPALSYSGSPIAYNAAVLPTAATLSGPSTGIFGTESTAFTVSVNQPAWTGGVTVTPGSTSSGDTFQATSGGSNVSSVTIPAGSTSVTFYLMPGGTAGNRSISITTSPALKL